jgi:hypothetical protein
MEHDAIINIHNQEFMKVHESIESNKEKVDAAISDLRDKTTESLEKGNERFTDIDRRLTTVETSMKIYIGIAGAIGLTILGNIGVLILIFQKLLLLTGN